MLGSPEPNPDGSAEPEVKDLWSHMSERKAAWLLAGPVTTKLPRSLRLKHSSLAGPLLNVSGTRQVRDSGMQLPSISLLTKIWVPRTTTKPFSGILH